MIPSGHLKAANVPAEAVQHHVVARPGKAFALGAVQIDDALVLGLVQEDPHLYHPRAVLHPASDFFTINTLEENLHLIEQQGVDVTIIQPFTVDFSKKTYRQFIQEVIVGTLRAHTLVMGPNHAFGHQREGHHDNIKEYCRERKLEVVEIPEEMWHSAGVHSAVIRDRIRQRDWSTVNAMLGYPYTMKNVE